MACIAETRDGLESSQGSGLDLPPWPGMNGEGNREAPVHSSLEVARSAVWWWWWWWGTTGGSLGDRDTFFLHGQGAEALWEEGMNQLLIASS